MSPFNWLSGRMFKFVHGHNLVYNTCWEDPRLDHKALQLGPDDSVLVITSAGCNTLDYALASPQQIYAVDMNPRQNALLELKIAGIKNLPFETFFSMFGRGRLENVHHIYHENLRSSLSDWSRTYWDRFIKFFSTQSRRPFYFHGTSGTFAKAANIYLDRVVKVRPWLEEILSAPSLSQQRQIYDDHLKERLWTRSLRFAMKRDATWSMVGVPRAQREHLEQNYQGGIVEFVEECLDAVFAQLPLKDNYFWRVYMTGEYSPECCPEYLKPKNFAKLKDGLVDKIQVHTNSVQGFLETNDVQISHYVLLDHMDWLWDKFHPALVSEWQAIVQRAAPNARAIWRSGGLRTDFVDEIEINHNGRKQKIGEMLTYHRQLAEELHVKDRVHTYGSFHIVDLAA